MDNENLSICDVIKNNLKYYGGDHGELVQYCPDLFQLLQNLLNDKFVDWHSKMMISSAIAYLVLENDIIPDKTENGYIDDLFIMLHVLKEIKEKFGTDILEKYWKGNKNIGKFIDDLYNSTNSIVEKYSFEILHKVGLHKFLSLQLEEYSGTYPQRLSKLAREKRELLALLTYYVLKIENINMKNYNVEKLKENIKKIADYGEIQRLIEISKINHDIHDEKNQTQENYKEELKNKLNKEKIIIIFSNNSKKE